MPSTSSIWNILLDGAVVWVVPFAASMLFFDRSGALTVPKPLFKSIMVVVSFAAGSHRMLAALKRGQRSASEGLQLGAAWMALNWALDYALLLPLSKESVAEYAQDIGLRYLMMPMMGYVLGVAMEEGRRAQ